VLRSSWQRVRIACPNDPWHQPCIPCIQINARFGIFVFEAANDVNPHRAPSHGRLARLAGRQQHVLTCHGVPQHGSGFEWGWPSRAGLGCETLRRFVCLGQKSFNVSDSRGQQKIRQRGKPPSAQVMMRHEAGKKRVHRHGQEDRTRLKRHNPHDCVCTATLPLLARLRRTPSSGPPTTLDHPLVQATVTKQPFPLCTNLLTSPHQYVPWVDSSPRLSSRSSRTRKPACSCLGLMPQGRQPSSTS
jgi:hypothetical protein